MQRLSQLYEHDMQLELDEGEDESRNDDEEENHSERRGVFNEYAFKFNATSESLSACQVV